MDGLLGISSTVGKLPSLYKDGDALLSGDRDLRVLLVLGLELGRLGTGSVDAFEPVVEGLSSLMVIIASRCAFSLWSRRIFPSSTHRL